MSLAGRRNPDFEVDVVPAGREGHNSNGDALRKLTLLAGRRNPKFERRGFGRRGKGKQGHAVDTGHRSREDQISNLICGALPRQVEKGKPRERSRNKAARRMATTPLARSRNPEFKFLRRAPAGGDAGTDRDAEGVGMWIGCESLARRKLKSEI